MHRCDSDRSLFVLHCLPEQWVTSFANDSSDWRIALEWVSACCNGDGPELDRETNSRPIDSLMRSASCACFLAQLEGVTRRRPGGLSVVLRQPRSGRPYGLRCGPPSRTPGPPPEPGAHRHRQERRARGDTFALRLHARDGKIRADEAASSTEGSPSTPARSATTGHAKMLPSRYQLHTSSTGPYGR